MAEYKDTLNLPETAFPMKANLANREPARITAWADLALYEKIRQGASGKKRFVLHDGPPYANGHLHCGHALNKILKDIIVKSKTLGGYDAAFVPGWDCHGLPIELNVEKKIGKAGMKISHKEFRATCRAYAQSQIDIQREEFQRLGVFGDWEHPYATFDYAYEANIIRALGKVFENGHLQQGFKPVYWCMDCGSALAEAEVDYEDKRSLSLDVAFYAKDPEAMLKVVDKTLVVKPVIVPIWTTTPWSLPANEAVCLHPEVEYALVDAGSSYYLVAETLAKTVMHRYGIEDYTFVGVALGSEWRNQTLKHPFFDRLVPLIYGEHVTTDTGTGCVHTAPAHGPDDYRVGAEFGLPLVNPVLANGCFAPDLPLFANMPVLKSNEAILDSLQQTKTLLFQETITHSYPHCWRHKTPVIYLATPQWFLSMDKQDLRSALLKAIDGVRFIPDWGKARIISMVENRPDWCISRQRAWGTPIPFFLHKVTRELHPKTLALLEEVAKRVEKAGIDAWFDLDPETLLGAEAKDYDKSMDTLDVWFDAGVSHFSVLRTRPELNFPADVYFEGSDQHRGWFNSSLTTAVAIDGQAPYKAVLTHGYTVDAEGKKLSKSKGNYVSLDKLIQQHGADILRLWVSSTDYRNEVSISEEIIKRNADAYRRIRNTARFLLANISDFNPETDSVLSSQLVELDAWAIKRCQELQEEILKAYEAYHFHVIYQKIHNFCAVDMGSFYLDIIKDRQYTCPKDSIARRSCQTAMYHILQAVTRWLAPILSFTAEEIWQYIPGEKTESVFLDTWYQAWPSIAKIDMSYWQQLQLVRDEVNKALEGERQKGSIGSGLAAQITVYAKPELHAMLKRVGEELRFIFISSEAILKPWSEKPSSATLTNEELGLAIEVCASTFDKCARCWHRCEDIGSDLTYPDLCARCAGNLGDTPEMRQFA